MKNFLLPFLLGISITISVAATTTDLMTIKPATPKSVVVYDGDEPKDFIMKYVKLGYVFKHSHGIHGWSVVVMEKY